jgi:uncharacterized protein YcnI/copper(I)-binding protein
MFKTRLFTSFILSAVPAAVFAHATMQAPEAPADSYYLAVLQVPHGCDGKATTEVRIKLPEGFISAKPMPKPGWEIEIIKGKYQKSYELHGKPVTEGPLEIRWKNGNLPDEFFDTFTVNGKFSGIAAGTSVPFVSTQLCGSDGKITWDQIPAEGQNAHDLKNPAPMVALTAGEDHHGHHAQAEFTPVKAGELEITSAAIKATTPGQPVASGFVTVANNGGQDDRLVSVSVMGAERVEIHEMALNNDVMTMRKLNGGLVLPSGKTTEMKPGGLHLMLMGPKQPFAAGTTAKAVLEFEKAGKVEIEIPVQDMKPGMQHKM